MSFITHAILFLLGGGAGAYGWRLWSTRVIKPKTGPAPRPPT